MNNSSYSYQIMPAIRNIPSQIIILTIAILTLYRASQIEANLHKSILCILGGLILILFAISVINTVEILGESFEYDIHHHSKTIAILRVAFSTVCLISLLFIAILSACFSAINILSALKL